MGTVINLEELQKLGDNLRRKGQRIVTTNGCFDLLHVGHLRILKAAKEMGDVLIVGINSDASVSKLKGPNRPITKQDERAELLAGLACVDYVYIFSEDTPVEFLDNIKPLFHVKGSDYSTIDLAETPVVESHGGEVVILKLVPDHSTSSIVKKITASSL